MALAPTSLVATSRGCGKTPPSCHSDPALRERNLPAAGRSRLECFQRSARFLVVRHSHWRTPRNDRPRGFFRSLLRRTMILSALARSRRRSIRVRATLTHCGKRGGSARRFPQVAVVSLVLRQGEVSAPELMHEHALAPFYVIVSSRRDGEEETTIRA
jgi:hypothetical protein